MLRSPLLPLSALALAALFGARPAHAHLMPASQGTLNFAGDSVFSVIAVPVSALHGFDDDGDGLLGMGELERHHAELEAEIDRRFVLRDGEGQGTTVLVNLVLSPQHDAPSDRAEGVVALIHTRFARPPEGVELTCDLFGKPEGERRLTMKATRRPDGVEEAESAVLTPEEPEHRFFPKPMARAATGVPSGVGILFVLLVAAALGWRYGLGAAPQRRAPRPT
jgi:hypothetical protein